MLKNYVILLLCFAVFSKTHDYGSFNLTLKKFEICKGPKRNDCCINSREIINNSTITYDALVKKNMTLNKGKIVVMSNGKEFIRLLMKKPCDHLFLKPLLKTLLNVTKNCVVLKGHYNFKVDIQEVAQKYYAGSFLFGNWTFKSFFYSDECNLSCSEVEVELSPKKH